MVDNGNSYGERVSRLVGWGHWFAFFNIIAAMLIGTRYISQSPWPESFLGQLYLAVSWVGHFGFLVFALYLLVLFPLSFLMPSRKLFRMVAVVFATIGLTTLLIDTQTYQAINLHLTPVVWEVLFTDESNNSLSQDLQYLFVVVPLIFLLQLALSEWVWAKQRRLAHKHIGKPLAGIFFVAFIASHLIYVWADAYFYNPITAQRANFPLSYPMTAKSFMEKHGLLDREEYLKRQAENEGNVELVRYPLEKIEYSRRANPLNIVIVSVNNLRADMLKAEAMPHAQDFAQRSLRYNNHYSSSNDSYGMFGLFYGLPGSYASSIRSQASRPVLVDALLQQNYQFGLFSGNNFKEELFEETIFRGITPNNVEASGTGSQDAQAIDSWRKWVGEQSKSQPWFSFIELTTVEQFGSYNTANTNVGSATDRLSAGYALSAAAVDLHLKTIFDSIDDLGLNTSTLVLLTSNHGSEFNETQSNAWGSNSNYSRFQLHVPLIIQWPGKVPSDFDHRTSHLDVSVTLMQDLLGVSSNPNDFSSGRSLFDESKRSWILAGDARELALITNEHTTVIDKFGNFKLYDKNYQRLSDENPTLPVLMQGLTELQRFYTKGN